MSAEGDVTMPPPAALCGAVWPNCTAVNSFVSGCMEDLNEMGISMLLISIFY